MITPIEEVFSDETLAEVQLVVPESSVAAELRFSLHYGPTGIQHSGHNGGNIHNEYM